MFIAEDGSSPGCFTMKRHRRGEPRANGFPVEGVVLNVPPPQCALYEPRMPVSRVAHTAYPQRQQGFDLRGLSDKS